MYVGSWQGDSDIDIAWRLLDGDFSSRDFANFFECSFDIV